MAQFGSLEMVDPVSGGDGIPAGETKINLDTLEGYFNQEGFLKKEKKKWEYCWDLIDHYRIKKKSKYWEK